MNNLSHLSNADLLKIISDAGKRITSRKLRLGLEKKYKSNIPESANLVETVPALKRLLAQGLLKKVVGKGKKKKWLFFETADYNPETRERGTTTPRKQIIPKKPKETPMAPISFWEELPQLVSTMNRGLKLIETKGLEMKEIYDQAASTLQDLQALRELFGKEIEDLRRQVEELHARFQTADGGSKNMAEIAGDLARITQRIEESPGLGRPVGIIARDESAIKMTGPICEKCRIRMATNEELVEDNQKQYHRYCFEEVYKKQYGKRPDLEPIEGRPHTFQMTVSAKKR